MKRSRRKRFGIAVACVIVALIGGELFCRYWLGLGDPPLSRTDPEIEYLFVGPRTYHRFGNTMTYNTYGMRTREFAARRKDAQEVRLLFCGDSVLNGGALTDQKDLATERIEHRIGEELRRPAVAMNVSAGSWGPPNYLAYVKRNGFFEADALVIVVSSHDFADSPTFAPVVGVSEDFPDRTPTFALGEAVTRYLPRYLPHFGSESAAEVQVSQGQIDQAMGAFRELIRMARERQIPVIVAHNIEQRELGNPEVEGHKMLREAATELGATQVEFSDAFGAAVKAGKSPYRDNIHPNSYGQQLMAEALYPVILKAVAAKGATSAPAGGG